MEAVGLAKRFIWVPNKLFGQPNTCLKDEMEQWIFSVQQRRRTYILPLSLTIATSIHLSNCGMSGGYVVHIPCPSRRKREDRNKGSSEPLWLLKVMLPSLLQLQVDPEDHLRKETGHHWVFS